MSDFAINVENLGKKYVLRHQTEGRRYKALRDVIAGKAKSLMKFGGEKRSPAREEFWALRDVSFTIKQGEAVGIIGRNGAGKSTLLKLLSRITEPTTGKIHIRGRVASLLEVGTGFHPELTGRENIFLNGAILGMSRVEIKKKFDEIVGFAEVEKFLDTPVKHYSSGMYMRLAFAVAAHLEPEILIVDEVLAVGDAQFQKKCLGKMQDVAQRGRTVLFVSHNFSAVRNLTTRCVLLLQGGLDYLGSPESAIAHYLKTKDDSQHDVEHRRRKHDCVGGARFNKLRFQQQPAVLYAGQRIEFIAMVDWERPMQAARISLTIYTQEELPVGSGFSAPCISTSSAGRSTLRVSIPAITLAPGRYHCTVALGLKSGASPVNMDAVSEVLQFEVVASGTNGIIPMEWHPEWGAVQLPTLEVTPLL